MAELMFLLAFFLPPAIVVLSVAAVAIGSFSRRVESSGRLRQHHA